MSTSPFTVRTAVVVLLIALCVSGAYFYLSSHTGAPAVSSPSTTGGYQLPASITVHHTFTNGVHSYKGSIPVGLTCQRLESATSAAGKNPLELTLVLTVRTLSEPCLPLPKELVEQSFDMAVAPAAGIKLEFKGVTINGTAVPVNLVEGL